jgi:asparagine synthase (glutamine-hydrolysing)
MCGIAGYFSPEAIPEDQARARLRLMTDAIVHRGPDDQGQWYEASAGIGLGMRRLSIIDLSPAGHQPMRSACGRYVLVFNGEIYNHKSIRHDLESRGVSPAWRGHSDTEVLLAAIAAMGLKKALQLANGMFAIALWDSRERMLELAVDRFGEKPLYYGWANGQLLFGSELKALRAHPAWVGDIDRNAISLLLRHGYIPAPYCIYQGIRKVEPGQIIRLDTRNRQLNPDCYWSTPEMVERSLASPMDATDSEATDAFETLLADAVGLRMEADVPLGAFLSGGFDSTAIVAMMQRQSSRPVRTFTIGFQLPDYDEAPFARAVAKHLQTDHTELYVTPSEAIDIIPRIPDMYDEPFADSSQIPTFLVSRMAKQHVTVALSGDAGDELFGGYQRYFVSQRIIPRVARWPIGVRRFSADVIEKVGAHRWDALYHALTLGRGRMLVGDRALKLASLIREVTPRDGYRNLISAWDRPMKALMNAEEYVLCFDGPVVEKLGFVEQMMYLDLMTYLPGDILTKVDRASMAVSLEARVPFLDPRIAEFAWRLPLSKKVSGGVGKRMIRNLVYRYVPQKLMDRPKSGFGVPVEEWLRGPLRDWAQSLLSPERIRASGYFDPGTVKDIWDRHQTGRRNEQARLWPILMFEAWLEAERSAPHSQTGGIASAGISNFATTGRT